MQRWIRLADGIDRFSEWTGRLLCWLTLAMVVIGAYNAVVRYLDRFTGLSLSSNTYIELQWYLFSLVFLLGAAYTLRHDAHVRVDVLYTRLSPKGKAWINLLGTLLFLLPFCMLMIWVSWESVMNSWRELEMSPDPGGLPRYPIKTAIPIAFVLLIIQGFSILIRQVAVLRGAPPAEETRLPEAG
jgi:TRAP-type mannitol/chloroaromatic compound transport system permease small subunit